MPKLPKIKIRKKSPKRKQFNYKIAFPATNFIACTNPFQAF